MEEKVYRSLTDKEERIMRMAPAFGGPFTVKGLCEALGEIISVRDVEPLVQEGLLAEEERPKAIPAGQTLPPRRLTVTDQGKAAKAPENGAMRELTASQVRELHRTFEAVGELDSERAARLAETYGVDPIRIFGCHARWKASKEAAAAAGPVATEETVIKPPAGEPPKEAAPASEEPPAPEQQPEAKPKKERITGDRKAELWKRFDAGEGVSAESEAHLAKEFNSTEIAIGAQKTDWAKAKKAALRPAVGPDLDKLAPGLPQLTTEERAALAEPFLSADLPGILRPEIIAMYPPKVINEADVHARGIIQQYRLDDCQRAELIERILDRGWETVAREVAADRGALDGLKAETGRKPTPGYFESLFIDEPGSQVEAPAPRPGITQPNLCETCIKSDVCMLLNEADMRRQVHHMNGGQVSIRYGARPVLECTAHRPDQVSA